MNGYINSFQSMGTLDGPGIRCVVFTQGCPLRCGYCHNPETWEKGTADNSEVTTAKELFEKILKYRMYFGENGGVTVSGGEPLLQAAFVAELFGMCRREGISTCLDTSGALWNNDVERLLAVTDICLLDYKMTNAEDYKKYTLADMAKVESFMAALSVRKIRTWVRQVIVPELNGSEESIKRLKSFAESNPFTEKIQLLPFHKMCREKYERLGIPFRFKDLSEPTNELMERLNQVLSPDMN